LDAIMISKLWRQRLTYAAMSAFVAWHALAMIIAPAPDGSEAIKTLRVPFQPYLSLFKLDNQWDFFAPNVGAGSQFRYIVEDSNGNHHPFAADRELSWFHPSFFWFRSWFNVIFDNPETYAVTAGAFFCHKHAALHPIAVILLEAAQGDFTPEDQLAGKRPLDPEFVTVTTVKKVECARS
jgi:hypothetical protein